MARSATRAPSRGRIHDRNRISAIRAATLRTGLGPYMRVRIHSAPPRSPSPCAVLAQNNAMRLCRASLALPVSAENENETTLRRLLQGFGRDRTQRRLTQIDIDDLGADGDSFGHIRNRQRAHQRIIQRLRDEDASEPRIFSLLTPTARNRNSRRPANRRHYLE